ncbi:MAG TPA: YggS family pyridoxal phosphate enzyme [Acidimicrobiia bacterium]|nr:YggS family pyridoxal phosphate enzyme [Acidimicrobiia bacterium]
MSQDGTHPGRIAARLAQVRDRIERAGGDPGTVTVLAVTKGFGPGAVEAAWAAGLAEVGENYAQELLAKREALAGRGPDGQRWHFLGAVQTNKVARLAPHVDCWQSVSRHLEGERIARTAPGARVLVQVGFATGAGRPGAEPAAVPGLVEGLRRLDLDVAGLMAVAPRGVAARSAFATVRRLADDLGLPVRSMGMTEDLELAVAEGSTLVRVGRALFGERPGPEAGG